MAPRTVLPDLADALPTLIAVAAGRAAADMVIRNGIWVNVHSRELLPDHDIAIAAGRFAYCGPDAGHCIGDDTQIIDAGGRFMIPGLCDGHMHIESGMLTPARFAAAVIPHGTTSMFVDPHEIANVLGLRGVRLMHDGSLDLYAPFGLDDIFSFRITPNRVIDNSQTHMAKAARAIANWPEVRVVPW